MTAELSINLAMRMLPGRAIDVAAFDDVWYRVLAPLIYTMSMVFAPFVYASIGFSRAREYAVLLFAREVRRTVYQGDRTLIVEYLSATTAILLGGVLLIAQPGSGARALSIVFPVEIWATASLIVGIFQVIAALSRKPGERAQTCTIAMILWAVMSALLFRRSGFTMFHAFTVPLFFALWLSMFILTAQAEGESGSTGE